MLRSAAKIDVLNIAYKGAGAALNDIIAGHVQFQVNTTLATAAIHSGGQTARASHLRRSKRTSTLPQVAPTVAETLPGFESSGWYALLGPAGMPRDVVLKLHAAFSKAIQSPDLIKRLTEQGVDVIAGSPDELTRLMPLEITKWAAAVKGLRARRATKTRGISRSPAGRSNLRLQGRHVIPQSGGCKGGCARNACAVGGSLRK